MTVSRQPCQLRIMKDRDCGNQRRCRHLISTISYLRISFERSIKPRPNSLSRIRKDLLSTSHQARLFTQEFILKLLSQNNNTKTNKHGLAYNQQTQPFHEYYNWLEKLLLKLDNVASLGNQEIKRERKQIVLEIQSELDRLDKLLIHQ